MNKRNPLTLQRMQVGRILKRETIGTLAYNTSVDIDLVDVDCSVGIVLDFTFSIGKTPKTGHVSMYRKSMLLRSSGTDAVKYGHLAIATAAETAAAFALGMNGGGALLIDTGVESLGLTNSLADGVGGIDITDFTYIIRIVDVPTSVEGR